MFKRTHHQFIELILTSLDGSLLRQHTCWFGGGTAIALRKAEYRESVDIDFLVADFEHYRNLRKLLRGRGNMAPLLRDGAPSLSITREWRVDQYGIRTAVDIGPRPIKFEIVNEARIGFSTPKRADNVCGITTLSLQDLAACKLLANSDRGLDDSVFSRDVIDMAFLDLPLSQLVAAVGKASQAYGISVISDMQTACDRLCAGDGKLARCMNALSINEPRATVFQRLKTLSRRLQLVSAKLSLPK